MRKLKNKVKSLLLSIPLFSYFWLIKRDADFKRSYRTRRKFYKDASQKSGKIYIHDKAEDHISDGLKRNRYNIKPKNLGEIHTFAFIPSIAWHATLLPDLKLIGPLTHFSYTDMKITWEALSHPCSKSPNLRKAVCTAAVEALRVAHRKNPVDWIFCYAAGHELDIEFLRVAREELGIPCVGMCFDDKNSWEGPLIGKQKTGQIDLAKHFDINWTSALVACDWYLNEGGNPYFLPEGFDTSIFRPNHAKHQIPVTFVGAAYGFRQKLVEKLIKNHIPIECFGEGWPNGRVSIEKQVEIFNSSKINLGMGGIGYTENITNVKGRDFEIPGTGGGLYLTSYNADLSNFFHISKEISCYANIDELIENIHYLLRDSETREAIAKCGFGRAIREHRWYNRYVKILSLLGINNTTESVKF
jgi:hypothetical protein